MGSSARASSVSRSATAQRARVLLGRFAVRASGSRALSCLRCPPQHAVQITSRLRVVGQAREINVTAVVRDEPLEHAAMQCEPAVGRDRVLDRQPCELVAKRDMRPTRDQHPGAETLLEAFDVLGQQQFKQPEIDVTRDHRDRLKQPPCGLRQVSGACEHGITNRVGDQLAAGREYLGDKERIAARALVQLVGVDGVRVRERRHPGLRQPLDLQPSGHAQQRAEHHRKRSARSNSSSR